ncbi:dihydroxy-acid dehydratase [Thermodesulfobacteriota bacterium]
MVRQAIMRGTGVDMEELKEKPMIGVVNSHTEINPGHMHLRGLARRVKEGVHAGGGIPFEFNVPAPCDGITEGNEGMRFVLPQRELIADMVETHTRSMLFDGIVMIASCDKIIPGMLMAAARLDLPTIFLTGGPNAWHIRFMAGRRGSVDHKDYADIEEKMATATCATCGACELMGTANTMQCIVEALGLTLPGSANVPAFHTEKLLFGRKVGKRIVEMVDEGLTACTVLTREALRNALAVDLAIGGSTNAALHLPALAHEIGETMPLETFNDFSTRIPTLCAVSPNGPHGVMDLYAAGGVPAVMKVLVDDLHLDARTVTGGTLADVVAAARVLDDDVIAPRDRPRQPEGGTVALFGNLAPDGAIVKQSSVVPEMRTFTGEARVFEAEAEALAALREGTVLEGQVLVIRNEGPRGGPGMPETLAVTMAIDLMGLEKVALITDGRFSGASYGPCVGHVSPEAHEGGPIAAVCNGDRITIDIPNRKLEVGLTDDEIAGRLERYRPPERQVPPGFMRRYVKSVSSAARGAILE